MICIPSTRRISRPLLIVQNDLISSTQINRTLLMDNFKLIKILVAFGAFKTKVSQIVWTSLAKKKSNKTILIITVGSADSARGFGVMIHRREDGQRTYRLNQIYLTYKWDKIRQTAIIIQSLSSSQITLSSTWTTKLN